MSYRNKNQPINNSSDSINFIDSMLNLMKNLTKEEMIYTKYKTRGKISNILNDIKNIKDKNDLIKNLNHLKKEEININGLKPINELLIEIEQIDSNIKENKENKIEEENNSASNNNTEHIYEQIDRNEVVENFKIYIESSSNPLKNFDEGKYNSLISDMMEKITIKRKENVTYCINKKKPITNIGFFINSRQIQCIMSYYKKLILDEKQFGEFVKNKYNSLNEGEYFSEYISLIKAIINEQTDTDTQEFSKNISILL